MYKLLAYLLIITSSSFALTHPSCTKKEELPPKKETRQTEVKPFIDFTNKSILKKQTQEHRKTIYNHLIKEGIPTHIAKYAYKLNFIKRPTVDYKNQPEFKFTLDWYSRKFINRAPRARRFLSQYAEAFAQAEKKYGVDKEVIASLMLIESNLGKNKGRLNILDALFTMSHPYTSSRTDFFTGELISAFKLLSSNKHLFRNNTMGSWAGAMGYVQFTPSSVLAYAVDGNEDGITDIINNKVDAIHSAANYLKNAKWKQGEDVMIEINAEHLTDIDVCKDLNQPYQNGVLVLAELNPERYIVTYNNYKALLRWNRSFMFAYGVQSVMNELKKSTEK